MRTHINALAVACLATLTFTACTKEVKEPVQDDISQETLAQIKLQGFSTENVQRVDEGYLVEGDLILTEANLKENVSSPTLRIAQVEQYRTNNLVNAGTGRTITVSLDSRLPTTYKAGLDEAIRRFNAENLSLKFEYASSNGNIQLVRGSGSYLASAGFPSGGNPYGQVKVNSTYIGKNPNTNYLATILAHEIGHCIGFRHTDYMDRSFSCGGSYANEGASTVGAVHIPGTPTTADGTSWMLACIGSGQNRYFNNNDKAALTYLY